MKRLLAIGVILLFIGMSVFPSTGIFLFNEDKTTPETAVILHLYKNENINFWCVNDVKTTSIANDDISGSNVPFSSEYNEFWRTHTKPFAEYNNRNKGEKTSILTFNVNTLYVGGSGEDNYTSIQDAIDNASDGDTIYVYNGTYQDETITIDKAIMLLGENKSTTFIDGYYSDGVIILVTSSDVTIREFTLKNCLKEGFGQAFYLWGNPYLENICISDCIMENNDKGIFLININNLSVSSCHFHHNPGQSVWGYEDSSNITINNCLVHNNGKDLGGGWFRNGGIQFRSAHYDRFSNISVFDCIIYDNHGYGITIEAEESENIVIDNNNIYSNLQIGIYSYGIKNLEIRNNDVYDNYYYGVFVKNSENVNIYENQVISNGVFDDDPHRSTSGIGLNSISSLILRNNTIIFNNGWGIGMYCDLALICGNNLTNNAYGIHLYNSNNNTISDNLILKSEYGIYLYADSNFNIISDNLISKNINGTFISYSGKNIISSNKISENENGIYIRDVKLPNTQYFGKHKIEFNNFIDNNRDAFFRIEPYLFRNMLKAYNKWNNNYWGEPRHNPKPIFGTVNIVLFHITLFPFFPWIQFDWNPASEPYDIGV